MRAGRAAVWIVGIVGATIVGTFLASRIFRAVGLGSDGLPAAPSGGGYSGGGASTGGGSDAGFFSWLATLPGKAIDAITGTGPKGGPAPPAGVYASPGGGVAPPGTYAGAGAPVLHPVTPAPPRPGGLPVTVPSAGAGRSASPAYPGRQLP